MNRKMVVFGLIVVIVGAAIYIFLKIDIDLDADRLSVNTSNFDTTGPVTDSIFNCGGYLLEHPSDWYVLYDDYDDSVQCVFSNLNEREMTPNGPIPKGRAEAVAVVQVGPKPDDSLEQSLYVEDCEGDDKCDGVNTLSTSTVSFRNVDVIKTVYEIVGYDSYENDTYEVYSYEDGDVLVQMTVNGGRPEYTAQALAVISSIKK